MVLKNLTREGGKVLKKSSGKGPYVLRTDIPAIILCHDEAGHHFWALTNASPGGGTRQPARGTSVLSAIGHHPSAMTNRHPRHHPLP